MVKKILGLAIPLAPSQVLQMFMLMSDRMLLSMKDPSHPAVALSAGYL